MRVLRGRPWVKPALIGVALAAVIAAMFADTTYLSRSAAAKDVPGAFNAATYARDNFAKIAKKIAAKAVDVRALAPAYDSSPAAAGKKYGTDLGAGSFAYCVKATGTITAVDANFALVQVTGLPKGDVVRVPTGLALNGAPVRDCTGTISYGDFNDQTDYQNVAGQFQALMKTKVLDPARLAAGKGKQISIVGAFASGGPPHSFLVQPVSIEAA